MVPSVGFISALEAIRAPSPRAAAIAAASIRSRSPTAWAKPRRICDRMTPLLPRAPMSDPWAAARITEPADVGIGAACASSTAERSVRYMLEPVSPSGTGKTLRSLTCSWLACSHARELRRPASRASPSTSRSGSRTVSVAARSAPAIVLLEVDALDVDVHGDDVDAEGLLDLVLDSAHQVVGHLADSGPVLGDDVQLDDQPAVPDLDLDTAVDGLSIEPLSDAVAQPASRHPDHSVALVGRVADDGCHDPRRHLDLAEAPGPGQGPCGALPAGHIAPMGSGTLPCAILARTHLPDSPSRPAQGS